MINVFFCCSWDGDTKHFLDDKYRPLTNNSLGIWKNIIAVVQGSAFGLEGFFRISYATSMDNLKKAMDKISSFCKSLS